LVVSLSRWPNGTPRLPDDGRVAGQVLAPPADDPPQLGQPVEPPGGRRLPNDLGLFDMLGNVIEWCHDSGVYFDPTPEEWKDSDDADLVPVLNKVMRVLRGCIR
jgi:formylglycine-generating enzyme required for sulfatase activity